MIDSSLGILVDQAFMGSSLLGRDAWRAAAEAGADWIALTEEAMTVTPEVLHALRTDVETAGVPVVMAQCHAFGLNDPREVAREWNIVRTERHVDLARELGAPVLKILLGEWIWRTMWPTATQWQLLVDAVRRIGDYAAPRGVEVSVELEPLDHSLVNDIASLSRLITEVDSEAVLANIDTSHMVVRGVPADEVARLGGRVNSVDFSDSNGRYHEHLAPGDGVADLAAFVTQLRAAQARAIAVEVGPFADPENAFRKVERAILGTRALFADSVVPRA
ncbi:sugar phosphate isomerase/epimerase family protein [Amycolatopsis vastitatis]|uniref:Xylose isomerase n=1 Tax=Amycolatopsis vastitatis TaxID=1905142 RepID=A0A229TF34_9PSEU|nr:sugar phosphate isomerase/epimerase family protein [Amycolatopsis vastitatis]OXM69561.1 xylose isomerase [Amycolatopsis vastitatis]